MSRDTSIPHLLTITVSGPVQTGKSSIVASIKRELEANGYTVCIPDRNTANDPSPPLDEAKPHERPKKDTAVIAIVEVTHG